MKKIGPAAVHREGWEDPGEDPAGHQGFLMICSSLCDKAVWCELVLPGRRWNTTHFSDVRLSMHASQCFLSVFALDHEGRRCYSTGSSQDDSSLSISHLQQNRKKWRELCALCLPSHLLVFSKGLLFPQHLCQVGCWVKLSTGRAPGVPGCTVRLHYRCTR